jgi:CheY-like chemotaxis protein
MSEPMHDALRILLVEDDPADAALVEGALDAHPRPSELHVTGDGAEALAFLRHQDPYADAPRPDLILLDLNMPRMSGHEALQQIKTDPALRTIPVVVFTTSSLPEDVSDSYHAYANAYVTKPLDLDALVTAVEAIHRFYGEIATRPPAS